MHIDASILPASLAEVPALAAAAEQAGFDAVWTSETQHDPFLPLALAAGSTRRLKLGTAVAIAFARSPTVLAHTAWDLAAHSGGRFILGLGTQIRPHIERRFGMPWPDSPAGQLREFIQGLRAIWHSWQTGERLNFRGQHYKLTLMTPFFTPAPIAHPDIPIYIAGVNTGLAQLAGEACDGFHLHPLHTLPYLEQVLRPALRLGAQKAGRDAARVAVTGSVFVVTSDAEAAFVRQQIAFYASTPSYRAVLAHHGWEAVADQLTALSRRGEWAEMAGLVSDEMLAQVAVIAAPELLGAALRARYAGVLDRLMIYRPFSLGAQPEWSALTAALAA